MNAFPEFKGAPSPADRPAPDQRADRAVDRLTRPPIPRTRLGLPDPGWSDHAANLHGKPAAYKASYWTAYGAVIVGLVAGLAWLARLVLPLIRPR